MDRWWGEKRKHRINLLNPAFCHKGGRLFVRNHPQHEGEAENFWKGEIGH